MEISGYTYGPTAEMLVGPDKVKFVIHTHVFCQRSSFLKAAVAEKWNPDKKAIELPEDDPRTFDNYLACVYQGPKSVGDKNSELGDIDLSQTYVLASKLCDLETANQIIDEIIQRSHRSSILPSPTATRIAFEDSPDKSPLRRLMVDYYIHERVIVSSFEHVEKHVPTQFFMDVAKEYKRLISVRRITTSIDGIFRVKIRGRGKCHYHMHDAACPPCDERKGESTDSDEE